MPKSSTAPRGKQRKLQSGRRRVISHYIAPDILKEIDEAAADESRSRAGMIELLCREALQRRQILK